MKIPFLQIDAFANKPFGGNPAGVCILNQWIDDSLMQSIAMENNLAETSFLLKKDGFWEIRWFTPLVEVDLCGHATLASAYALFIEGHEKGEKITFMSPRSGELNVSKSGDKLTLDFPMDEYSTCEAPIIALEALNINPSQCFRGKTDYVLIVDSQEALEKITPDFGKLKHCDGRGVIVTAKGKDVDFVSRFFAPQVGIDEDPVTGSAHTTLTPIWSNILGKSTMDAIQISKRKGHLTCSLSNDRVQISGKCQLFLQGEINI